MANFFEVFRERYISRLLLLNKTWLVSQTYHAGDETDDGSRKTPILLTDYDDKGLASVHKAAIKSDPFASIIDLNNSRHLATLRELLRPDSPYYLYWAVVQDRERFRKSLDQHYKDKIRRYLQKNTAWRIGADENLKPSVQMIFGELFMILKWRKQELRVKFAEIESC